MERTITMTLSVELGDSVNNDTIEQIVDYMRHTGAELERQADEKEWDVYVNYPHIDTILSHDGKDEY